MFCIWELTRPFLSCSVTQKRIVIVSLLGAVISAVCFLLPFMLWQRLLLGTFISASVSVILLTGRKHKMKLYIKCIVFAAQIGVLLGGSIAILQKFIVRKEFAIGQMVMVTVVLSFLLKSLLQRYFLTRKKLIYPVVLFCDGEEYHMQALLDTGNSLVEPISKKAVCLVGKDFFKRQWEKEGKPKGFQPQKFRVVPYHAVGTPNGILSGYEMDRLIIFTDERKVEIQKPVIGISEYSVGTPESYQMILQPKLLGEGVR